MLKVILLFISVVKLNQIELHTNVGVATQETHEKFIKRQETQNFKVYIPVELIVPEGPLKAETQARLHEEITKLNNKTGLNDYVVNSTSQVYACARLEKKRCKEGYTAVKQGKLLASIFILLYIYRSDRK